jgi:hypothetical protein
MRRLARSGRGSTPARGRANRCRARGPGAFRDGALVTVRIVGAMGNRRRRRSSGWRRPGFVPSARRRCSDPTRWRGKNSARKPVTRGRAGVRGRAESCLFGQPPGALPYLTPKVNPRLWPGSRARPAANSGRLNALVITSTVSCDAGAVVARQGVGGEHMHVTALLPDAQFLACRRVAHDGLHSAVRAGAQVRVAGVDHFVAQPFRRAEAHARTNVQGEQGVLAGQRNGGIVSADEGERGRCRTSSSMGRPNEVGVLTGRPKGVSLTHRGAVNLALAQRDHLDVRRGYVAGAGTPRTGGSGRAPWGALPRLSTA